MPYWAFDFDMVSELSGSGVNTSTQHGFETNHTYTSTYDLYEKRHIVFQNIPFDASRKMDDSLMNAIEPFDMKEMVPFDEKYLLGFYSDKYDVSRESFKSKTQGMIRRLIRDSFFKQDGSGSYTSVWVKKEKTVVQSSESRYILLPTYILNYKYHGKTYTFLMNGQTGETTGYYPVSQLKKFLYCTGLFILIAVGIKLIASLLLGGFFG